MPPRECYFKGPNCTNYATSKEHVVHNSRRKLLRSKGATLGNEQAQFKGITCENCNEFLGRYEEKSVSSLALSTVWKVLAGNLNRAFGRANWAETKHSSRIDLEEHAEFLRKVFINQGELRENMLSYDIEYTANGGDTIEVSLCSEGIIITEETLEYTDLESGSRDSRLIDLIVYIHFDTQSKRMAFFLPLIPVDIGRKVKEGNAKVSHRGFETIFNSLGLNEHAYYRCRPYFDLST